MSGKPSLFMNEHFFKDLSVKSCSEIVTVLTDVYMFLNTFKASMHDD